MFNQCWGSQPLPRLAPGGAEQAFDIFFPANFAANHHLTTFHIPTWRKPKEIMIAPPPCPLHQTATFPHPAREKNTKNNPELGSENSKLWDGWRVPTQEENKCSADHQAGHHRKGKWRFVTCCIYVMCSDFYHFHLIPILISYFQLWLFGFCSQGIIIVFHRGRRSKKVNNPPSHQTFVVFTPSYL